MLDSARRWRVWGPWDVVLLASLTGSLQLPLGCFSAEGEAAGMRNSCSESEKGWSACSGLARIFCLQHVMLTSLSRLIDRLVWRLELVRCSEGGGVDVLAGTGDHELWKCLKRMMSSRRAARTVRASWFFSVVTCVCVFQDTSRLMWSSCQTSSPMTSMPSVAVTPPPCRSFIAASRERLPVRLWLSTLTSGRASCPLRRAAEGLRLVL